MSDDAHETHTDGVIRLDPGPSPKPIEELLRLWLTSYDSVGTFVATITMRMGADSPMFAVSLGEASPQDCDFTPTIRETVIKRIRAHNDFHRRVMIPDVEGLT